MPIVWCSISGHGYGHAAQIIPVLNELGKRVPGLRAVLRTNIAKKFLESTVAIPWEYSYSSQDIGCIQDGPLHVDIEKTWDAYQRFHSNWEQLVLDEARVIRAANPDLILSNISHLGIKAGLTAGCQTAALCSLSWDQVLTEYLMTGCDVQDGIIAQIREAYQGVCLTIRPHPSIPMVAFPSIIDVGPILPPEVKSHESIRQFFKIEPNDRVVLIAFGGIPLSSLPIAKLEKLRGYRFLISGPMNCEGFSRVDSINCVGVSFQKIFTEADIVMSKPGYATIVEAVRSRIPIVYVRRYNFVDEQCLVDYAHHYGRAAELSRQQFEFGDWQATLDAVLALPMPIESSPGEGTGEAADHLARLL